MIVATSAPWALSPTVRRVDAEPAAHPGPVGGHRPGIVAHVVAEVERGVGPHRHASVARGDGRPDPAAEVGEGSRPSRTAARSSGREHAGCLEGVPGLVDALGPCGLEARPSRAVHVDLVVVEEQHGRPVPRGAARPRARTGRGRA